MWLDEFITFIKYVQLPTGQILAQYDSKNHHMLFTLLAHGSVTVFGESSWAIRLPAALLGILSIPALYALGRLIASRAEAFLAAGFLTASYHHVWFSQNARGYTGLLLGALLTTVLFLKLLAAERIRPSLVLCYAAAAALSVWVHFTGSVVIIAHGMVWLWITSRAYGLRPPPASLTVLLTLVLAGLFSLALYGPVLLQMVDTLSGKVKLEQAAEWTRLSWFVMETIRNLGRGVPGGWLSIVPAAFVFGVGVRSYARQSWMVLGVLMIPALIVAAVILITGQNLWPRLFFFSAGFFVLIAVRGGVTIVGRVAPATRASRWALAVGMIVVLFSAYTVPRAWAPKQDFESAIRFVERQRSVEDIVLGADLVNLPLRHFYGRDWPPVGSVEKLSGFESGYSRTWVLYTFPIRLKAKHPELWARLRSEYRTAAVFPGTISGGDIVVVVKP
jgi:4-amino-4-deoxy-L-arabinose transferase-like glycosyltransferase